MRQFLGWAALNGIAYIAQHFVIFADECISGRMAQDLSEGGYFNSGEVYTGYINILIQKFQKKFRRVKKRIYIVGRILPLNPAEPFRMDGGIGDGVKISPSEFHPPYTAIPAAPEMTIRRIGDSFFPVKRRYTGKEAAKIAVRRTARGWTAMAERLPRQLLNTM